MGGGGRKKLCYGYALKADVRHYFDTVDHKILLCIIERKIQDKNILWLIRTILENHKTDTVGKGMPIGNLTSQFFANVYLNELDHFVKHKLRAKYYIRYVDDFVILHRDRKTLEKWRIRINQFLKDTLKIDLHTDKTRIVNLENGVTLLGFRMFYHYRLLKKSNTRRILRRFERFRKLYRNGLISKEEIIKRFDGWSAYAEFADTYNLRNKIITKYDDLLYESTVSG